MSDLPPLEINKATRNKPTLHVIHIGAVVALAIMGDSLMYSLLPLEANNLGIPLALVGILLSANRVIRLLSNTWVSLIFERWGPRIPFLVSAILGFITTIIYGIGWGFGAFLLARAGWGISWSGLRQGGYQGIWATTEKIKGRLMGFLWGVVRMGSAVSVILGGYLFDRFNFQTAVFVIAAITFIGIPLALFIKWSPHQPHHPDSSTSVFAGWRTAFKTSSLRWLLIVGFLDTFFEGVLGSTASLFLASRFSDLIKNESSIIGIGTLAGFLFALRYTANLLFGPLLGALSDRLGQPPTLLLLSVVMLGGIIALIVLPGYWALAGLVITFFAGSGMFAAENAAASDLAKRTSRPHLYVGFFTTSIDSGAALGPLIAFSIGAAAGFETLYLLGTILLFAASIRFLWVENIRSKSKD